VTKHNNQPRLLARGHNDGKGQQGDRRHDDGNGKHDDGDGRHDDGKGQQGNRRYIPVDDWVVVCRPFSLSYPFVAALPPDALVASRRPPVPFPLMVDCCVIVCHPFSLSYPCFCKRTLS
jgi:hypothetical protein